MSMSGPGSTFPDGVGFRCIPRTVFPATANTVSYSGPEQKELIIRAVRYAALYDCSRDEEAWNLMTALPLEAQVLVAWLLSESPRQAIAAQALGFLIEQRSKYEYDILKTMSYPTLKEKLP